MKKEYIDTDVYTEAKKRIRHIIETFDSILVCFSGGKDSLAVLCLVEEVYKEMGITRKIKVVFRDEELIPDDVVRFYSASFGEREELCEAKDSLSSVLSAVDRPFPRNDRAVDLSRKHGKGRCIDRELRAFIYGCA